MSCRVAWAEITDRKGMVHGEAGRRSLRHCIHTAISRPGRRPEAAFVKAEPSRRGGLVVLHYRSIGGSGIRILAAEEEGVTVRRLLTP
jgi:hypothetical protein